MASTPTKQRLVPRLEETKPTPHGTRLEYFCVAKYSSPSSGQVRHVRASYKWHHVQDAASWLALPRRKRTDISARASMSKKRCFQKFQIAQRWLDKETTDVAERRLQIKQAAGYPVLSDFDRAVVGAVKRSHGHMAAALNQLKRQGMVAPKSPQDSTAYVRRHTEGLEHCAEACASWESAQLQLEGLLG